MGGSIDSALCRRTSLSVARSSAVSSSTSAYFSGYRRLASSPWPRAQALSKPFQSECERKLGAHRFRRFCLAQAEGSKAFLRHSHGLVRPLGRLHLLRALPQQPVQPVGIVRTERLSQRVCAGDGLDQPRKRALQLLQSYQRLHLVGGELPLCVALRRGWHVRDGRVE